MKVWFLLFAVRMLPEGAVRSEYNYLYVIFCYKMPCSLGNFEKSFETRGPDTVNMKIMTFYLFFIEPLNSRVGALHGT
jgi:hypothetical protein